MNQVFLSLKYAPDRYDLSSSLIFFLIITLLVIDEITTGAISTYTAIDIASNILVLISPAVLDANTLYPRRRTYHEITYTC